MDTVYQRRVNRLVWYQDQTNMLSTHVNLTNHPGWSLVTISTRLKSSPDGSLGSTFAELPVGPGDE